MTTLTWSGKTTFLNKPIDKSSNLRTLDKVNTHIHENLIEQCKLGQRQAQYELYNLYIDAMYNISSNMLPSREDAEDVLQESFTNAFKSIKTFDYQSTFGAWLKRIVINTSINAIKKKKLPLDNFDGQEYKITDTSTEENTKEERYDVNKVREGIDLLPPGFKKVLTLYLIEGYDHVEISEVLGISVSTSKTQYSRAKTKLKEIIKTL